MRRMAMPLVTNLQGIAQVSRVWVAGDVQGEVGEDIFV